ncbi:DUF4386 domain-containing protein [bacterium]|nr:DUF4386 domain-containing protein [bacterium]
MKAKAAREERKTAITVGVLYIIATAAGIAAVMMNAPTGLAQMAAGKSAILATALFDIVMAVAVAGLGVMLYPVLMRDADTSSKQGLTTWYVGTRITEGALFFVGVIALVSMLSVSEAMAGVSAVQTASYEAAALALKTVFDYSWIAGQTIFCVGAAMLYWLLYVSKRVPRWLSVWGLVAAPMMLVAGFMLPITNDPNSTISSLLYVPMGLQEMVLAVWLIAWGFRPPVAKAGV